MEKSSSNVNFYQIVAKSSLQVERVASPASLDGKETGSTTLTIVNVLEMPSIINSHGLWQCQDEKCHKSQRVPHQIWCQSRELNYLASHFEIKSLNATKLWISIVYKVDGWQVEQSCAGRVCPDPHHQAAGHHSPTNLLQKTCATVYKGNSRKKFRSFVISSFNTFSRFRKEMFGASNWSTIGPIFPTFNRKKSTRLDPSFFLSSRSDFYIFGKGRRRRHQPLRSALTCKRGIWRENQKDKGLS